MANKYQTPVFVCKAHKKRGLSHYTREQVRSLKQLIAGSATIAFLLVAFFVAAAIDQNTLALSARWNNAPLNLEQVTLSGGLLLERVLGVK